MSEPPAKAAPTEPVEPAERPEPPKAMRALLRALRWLAQFPFTIALVAVMIVIAILTGTHITPLARLPWYHDVATGLPAFRQGHWWTLGTSPWFIAHPLRVIGALPLVIGGVGWAEAKFGSLRALGLFLAGHLVGALGAAGTLALAAGNGWPWAAQVSRALDVGPASGAIACLVFAMSTLPSPWRLRARYAVVAWAAIGLLYVGKIVNVEHAIVVGVALLVSGLLPAFRHPAGRPTVREWRLLGFVGLIVIGVVEVFALLIPFNGPLGENDPVTPTTDVVIDLVAIAILANGVRLGLRLAWIATIAFACFNLATAVIATVFLPQALDLGLLDEPGILFTSILPSAVLWLAQLIVMLLGRGAFRVPLLHSRRTFAARTLTRTEALDRLREFGGGNISWMIGWPDNRHIAVGSGVIAYQAHAGVAIALGDPIAPKEQFGIALDEFARSAEHAGFVPCVFSASALSDENRPNGWRSAVIAEDTIVDLPDLAFTGKRWNSVRTSINRAAREGIEFRMCTLADEPWSVLAQVRAISEQWSGDKGLPEMRFTLGTVEEARDPETRVGIAVDAEGSLHGITSWLPVYGPGGQIHGWTLDLMRRRDDGFGPVMEYLIAESAKHFAEAGYEFVSLSGAPLVRPEQEDPGPVDFVLDRLSETLEPLYGFRSLHFFKRKFHPRHEPLYMLYRDEGDLPRIAVALTRAYLPDATLRDLASSAASARA
ncbi:bifunctional lysylphosphatidylglycerol flippase/synthetase MprF [Leucobacter sp. OLCS4]|uniref:bifunctional lysylphosphatidylglycerol flippase/synthetase MprF n=1 Tax=Leucobacter sp. OLCS4 TaxID=1914918 RepID=UPI001F52FC0C|nr:DUF2156 domain-containing protein [Leucobacter sp. OLCS4]